jgi:acyl CoA:acetate/3-ketoacid CoA transferase alpha subunit
MVTAEQVCSGETLAFGGFTTATTPTAVSKALADSRSRWIVFVLIGLCLAVGLGVVFIVRQIGGTLRQIAA